MATVRHHVQKIDLVLLAVVAGLIVFGLVMLTSASGPTALERHGDSYHFLKRQLLLGVLPGLVALAICAKFSIEFLKRLAPWTMLLALALLMLGFIPGLAADYGSGSWISLFGFSFQPSEPAKLLLVIYFAWWLARRGGDAIKTFWGGFLPFVISVGIVIGMMMVQSDLGTTAVIVAMLFSMYISAGAAFTHLAALLAGSFALFLFFIKIAPYRADRLKIFLHPDLDPHGVGYHVNQALLAIGTGGWFGLGLGKSRQKFLYLPEVAADSIFAVIAEETGFIISIALVAAFVFLLWRGFRIAERAGDDFSRYLAVGITVWLVFQAFMNISAMVGLMPLTGVPLPFISHGGSAMISNLAAVGVLLAISKSR
jgi:cell division protein FtsW